MAAKAQTLIDGLRDPLRPEHRIGYLTGPDPVFTSYAELHDRAQRVLGLLQDRGVGPGRFVVLVSADIQAFLELFWGCLLGGAVPVPVSAGGTDEHLLKIQRVLGLFDDPLLLIEADGRDRLAAWSEVPMPKVLTLDEVRSAAAGGVEGRLHDVKPDDLAYVQFSSGSTRAPKGIQLTHRNLVANTDGIIQAIQLEPEDRPHAWMPLTHDMGLIGGHLTPFMRGTNHTLIPTERFVRRPLTWMQEAATHGVTVTSGPNFAYQHTLRVYKPERFEGLDLSPVRVIFNGAEPISYELVKRFLNTFETHGLRPASMFPVYGLAEASLAVSMPPLLSGLRRTVVDRRKLGLGDTVRAPERPEDGLDLVPLGKAIPHCEFRIGDGAPDDTVGPIWIRGDNVTRRVRTEDGDLDPLVDGWYETGDLGFVSGGDLHVAGRVKEMAIVNGQNVYPHDVEAVASQVDGIELGKVIAAGVRDPGSGREVLALFVLWRKDDEEFTGLAQRLREHVTRQTGVAPSVIHPVSKIPKTTSGKLQRVRVAQSWEVGEL
ncbi:MAG: AMP-binding protein [Myxococcota bacterium]